MKKSEAAELVMMILAAYPNAKTSSSTSQVYETMLADLDPKTARQAVTALIATSKFVPTIAEIREACAAIVQAKRAALARQQAARIPSLTRAELGERDRNNWAREALVVPKGAAASEAVVGESRVRPEGAPHAAAAPADLVRRIAAKAPPMGPARPPRKWTAAELDAALADSRGGAA